MNQSFVKPKPQLSKNENNMYILASKRTLLLFGASK